MKTSVLRLRNGSVQSTSGGLRGWWGETSVDGRGGGRADRGFWKARSGRFHLDSPLLRFVCGS